ncbi:Cullin-4 [Allomyces javanicus]|nr:Cullin-4 [Allomyces javanicus]
MLHQPSSAHASRSSASAPPRQAAPASSAPSQPAAAALPRSLTFAQQSNFMLGPNGSTAAASTPTAAARPALGSKHFAKKLVIRDLNIKPTLPPDFEATTWAKLAAAITAIFARQPVADSLEELYKACEALCKHHFAANVYARVGAAITDQVRACFTYLAAVPDDDFLAPLVRAWTDFTDALLLVRAVFMYLDRTYALPRHERALYDLGLHLFAEHVILAHQHQLRDRALAAVDRALASARDLEAVPSSEIKSQLAGTAALFRALHLDAPVLSPHVVREARQTLARAASTELAVQMSDPAAYLDWIDAVLDREKVLAESMALAGAPDVDAAVRNVVIAQHADVLLAGVPAWLLDGDAAALARVMDRLASVNLLTPLVDQVGAWIAEQGCAIVEREAAKARGAAVPAIAGGQAAWHNPTGTVPMIEALLVFKQHVDDLVVAAFRSHADVQNAVKTALHKAMNAVKNKPAECMAKYVDEQLRSRRTVDEARLEQTLDQVLHLFRHVDAKDTFEAFYKQLLAKRLLLGRVTSMDAEKSMVARLRTERGVQSTEALDKMFADVELSDQLAKAFKDSRFAAQMPGGYDLSVIVCQSSAWPTLTTTVSALHGKSSGNGHDDDKSAPKPIGRLPEFMARGVDLFSQFYATQYSGRQLAWQHDMDQVTLKTSFGKELDVALVQALVLLEFADVDAPPLSFTELHARTGIEPAELKRTLQSLACGKVRVLKKSPPPARESGGEIADTDTFTPVAKLDQVKKYRFRIPQIIPREVQQQDDEHTHEQVAEDRSLALQAAIVRVMKARKVLPYQALLNEVISQCKFPVEASKFKLQIEDLTEREFLERDKDQHNVYRYVA